MAGKGDRYRKVDKKKFNKNYDIIFRKDIDKLRDGVKERSKTWSKTKKYKSRSEVKRDLNK